MAPQVFSAAVSLIALLAGMMPTAAHRSNCSVPHYRVEKSFDAHKFSGRWYGVKYLNSTRFPIDLGYGNVVYTFQEREDGNFTLIKQTRNSDADRNAECNTTDTGLVRMPNAGTAISARMTLQMSSDEEELPFWVMDTDHTSYAVIYQCLNWTYVEQTTFCPDDLVKSWVLTRSLEPLTDQQWKGINHTLRYYCTNDYDYYWVDHPQPGCSFCKPELWTVQPGFNLTMFSGHWYEVMFIIPNVDSPSNVWTDFEHIYSIENGQISVQAIARTTEDVCLKINNTEIKTTGINGKLTMKASPTSPTFDYWVISTDYDGYAVVMGCDMIFSTTGGCETFLLWVWSRRPYLSGPEALSVMQQLRTYCVPLHRVFGTPLDNPCFPPPTAPAPSPTNPVTPAPTVCETNSGFQTGLHGATVLLVAVLYAFQ